MNKRVLLPLMFVAVAILMLIGNSCAPGGKNEPTQRELAKPSEFILDTGKLGERVTLREISISVPRGWTRADSATEATVQEFAQKDTGSTALAPRFVFKREGGGPMLLISEFAQALNLGANFVPWAGEIARVYRTQRRDVKIEERWISLAGLDALELRSRSERLVHLKVLVRGSSPISLDYTIPIQDWPGEVAAVQSSLASIQRVTR